MRIYKGREWRINTGEYGEHIKIQGGVTVTPADLGYRSDDLIEMSQEERDELEDRLQALAENRLTKMQDPELKASLGSAIRNSFVRDLFDDDDYEDEEEPRRTSSRRTSRRTSRRRARR